MTRFEANIDAVRLFRTALLAFVHRQAGAMDAAESEINRTLQALAEAERDARYRVEGCRDRLHACLVEQVYAAAEGYAVDCSGYQYDLREAEDTLVHILQCAYHVQQVVEGFRSAMLRYGDVLENGIPRAGSYLDACIAAFEAYDAERLAAIAATQETLRGRSSKAPPTTAASQPFTPISSSSPEKRESIEGREGGPERRG